MPIVANPEPGVVLAGEFDRKDPKAREEVAQFTQRLAQLQKQLGFAAYIPLIAEKDGVYSISIIPAAADAAGAVGDAAQLGKALSGRLADKFSRSGPLKAPAEEVPDPYKDAAPSSEDAADMLSKWFPEDDAK